MAKLVLISIAALSKGQQQVSAQKPQQPKTQSNVQLQRQETIQSVSNDQTYRPITFPSGDEPLTNDRIQPIPTLNNNLVPQNVEQKSTTKIDSELVRPTRVVVATVANVANRYQDDQLDYIRDFAWTLFQVILNLP